MEPPISSRVPSANESESSAAPTNLILFRIGRPAVAPVRERLIVEWMLARTVRGSAGWIMVQIAGSNDAIPGIPYFFFQCKSDAARW